MWYDMRMLNDDIISMSSHVASAGTTVQCHRLDGTTCLAAEVTEQTTPGYGCNALGAPWLPLPQLVPERRPGLFR